MISPKLRQWIIATVTTVWAINFGATLIPPLNYKPDAAIHAVFMGIVGGVLALDKTGTKKTPKEEESKPKDEEKDEEGKPS